MSAPLTAQYEPVVRHVLRLRRTRLLAISFALTHVLVTSITAPNLLWDGLGSCLLQVIRPSTFVFSAFAWFFGVLPAILGRGSFNTRRASDATTNAFVRNTLTRPHTIKRAAFMSAAGFVWSLVAARAYDIGLFAPTKRHPYALNERLIFLSISLSSAGFAFAIYEALVQRDTIRWSLKSHKTPATIIASNLSLRRFGILLLASVFGPIILAVGYAMVKPLVIHALLALPVVGGSVRPFIAPLLRARAGRALDGGLYRLASAVAFRSLVAWEISGAVRAGYQAFPVRIAPLISDPVPALVQGVQNPSAYFEYTAWHDLARLPSASRRVIFASPNHWSVVLRTGLLRLGRDYQLLLRRGAPAPPPPPPPSTPLSSRPLRTSLGGSGAARIHELVPTSTAGYKDVSPSPGRVLADGLGSEGAVTKALSGVPDLFLGLGEAAGEVLGNARDRFGPAQTLKVPNVIPAVTTSVSSILQTTPSSSSEPFFVTPVPVKVVIEQLKWVHGMWTAPRPSAPGELAMPDASVDVVVVDALTKLIAASLDEDALGTAQRDIPRALEALCSLLDAVEDAERAGLGLPSLPLDPGADDRGAITEVGEALRRGLGLVCKTFGGGRMAAFRVPVRTARRLQTFLDYAA